MLIPLSDSLTRNQTAKKASSAELIPKFGSKAGLAARKDGKLFTFDPVAFDLVNNKAKYVKIAAKCCRNIKLSGSKVDGIYKKDDTLINGKIAYFTDLQVLDFKT